MARSGEPRRRRTNRRKVPGAMGDHRREALGTLTPEALVVHRELAYIRNPSAERLRKLQEAQAMLDGGDPPAAA